MIMRTKNRWKQPNTNPTQKMQSQCAFGRDGFLRADVLSPTAEIFIPVVQGFFFLPAAPSYCGLLACFAWSLC
jgi:hypothetical protein